MKKYGFSPRFAGAVEVAQADAGHAEVIEDVGFERIAFGQLGEQLLGLGRLQRPDLDPAVGKVPLAPVGVWVGVRVARKIQPTLFYRLVHIGMFCTGLKLLVDALLG